MKLLLITNFVDTFDASVVAVQESFLAAEDAIIILKCVGDE